ncbi:MAG: non-heme iron oxygenase ferredoxin subunit [Acidimicrobiales bacterium]
MGEQARVCEVSDLDPGTVRRVEVAGTPVALVRIGDELFAIGDTCSHEDYSLSEGQVFDEECELECWKHGSTFDLRTGAPCSLPATKPVPVYEVHIDDGHVVVTIP